MNPARTTDATSTPTPTDGATHPDHVGPAAALEHHLGDPYDDTNPYGFRALVAAHEAGRPLTGEPFAHHVPQPQDRAALPALRALYRRSPALAGPAADQTRATAALRTGAAVGTLDSGLRLTLRHLRARELYGAPAVDIPQLRAVLAGAFADLLLCDALTTPTADGDGPDTARSRAVQALVPRALQGAMDRLSMLLGSRFYLREGAHAGFPLLLRELQHELFSARSHQPTSEDRHPGPPPTPNATELLTAAQTTDLCDPAWLAAAPARALTTDVRRPTQPTGAVQAQLYADLVRRYETGHSFDLADRPVPDRPHRAP
ncbi:hypothetical protein ACMA1D_08975 [Streptomyces sp. 796.1]|uniref:hypothetical protein n=1 Tax=Streptomyces sp. 796.1 TaxID=3163029 RepID=UPI0039C8CE3D